MEVKCSMLIKARPNLYGKWSIQEMKGCVNTGMMIRHLIIKMEMALYTGASPHRDITTICSPMRLRMWFVGMNTGNAGLEPAVVSVPEV